MGVDDGEVGHADELDCEVADDVEGADHLPRLWRRGHGVCIAQALRVVSKKDGAWCS